MPHKHRRDKSKIDASFYDLPPTKTAQSLPVRKLASGTTTSIAKRKTKPAPRQRTHMQDDTPRAFTRLLGSYRPPRSGLDDGMRPSKRARKSSKVKSAPDPVTLTPAPIAVPTIQPREPLSSFAARVDAALPFSGLSKKSGAANQGGRERQTRTERKMQKMQEEWRKEDRRRKENLDEERHKNMDEEGFDDLVEVSTKGKKKSIKKKRKGGVQGVEISDDDDPWAHIAAKRLEENETKAASEPGAGLVGLHDVVSAPPKFSRVPNAKADFCIKVGVGGLKRQQELSEARMTVVEGYRNMMREMRGEGG